MAKYLDEAGVRKLWAKTKEKASKAQSNAVATAGNYTVNGKKISSNPTLSKSDVGLGNVTNDAQIPLSQKGAVDGVATLGADGKVPSSQLPSYVDDVLEGTLINATTFQLAEGQQGGVQLSNVIYVDTSTNKTYRWSGTTYVEISASLALGKTPGTAYPGNDGATLEQDLGTLEQTVSGVQSAVSDINNTITSIKDYEFLYAKNTTKPIFNTAATSGSINFPTVEFNGPSVDSVQVTIPTFTNSTAGLVEAPQHTDGTDLDILTNKGWSTLAFEFDSSNRNFKLYAGDSSNPIDSMYFNISSASEFGFIRTGYTATGKNYAVQVDSSGNAYVNVPWTDYNVATPSANGLMSAEDKKLLDYYNANRGYYLEVSYSGDLVYGTDNVKLGHTFQGSMDAGDNIDVILLAATRKTAGTMSATDKAKLDDIEALTDAEIDAILV